MYEVPNNDEEIFSGTNVFETLFRWNREWQAAIIKPFRHDDRFLHYIVKLIGGPIVLVWQNDYGDWVELKKGITERSAALGKAIEYLMMAPGIDAGT